MALKPQSAKFYIKELEAKRTEREPLETFWRNAYELTFPLRGQKFQSTSLDAAAIRSSASADQAEIYDSTAIISSKLLVSSIMSGMFPAHAQWLGLELRNNQDKDIEEWLEEAAKTLWKNIHASNFDVVGFEALVDLVVAGMFAIFITEGTEESGQPYKFEQWPLASIYPGDSTGDGVIDTIYREFELTAEQAVNTYDEDNLHKDIVEAAKKKPSTKFKFLHVIHPHPNHNKLQLPVASVHVDLKRKKILRKDKGFHEMPVVVPRWFVLPDSVYATGPVDDALPDIRTVNEVKKILLASGEMSYTGMWGAVDDGVLNPASVKIGPRKVIPVANKDSFFPLSSGVDLNFGDLTVEDLRGSIEKILMTDQLTPRDGPALTATEAHINVQLVRRVLGPMYGRLMVEMLAPTVTRCFGIAIRNGALSDMPQGLEGKTANVRYLNPLAKAQKLETIGAMERLEEGLFGQAGAGMPEVLDIYDIDAANREKGEMLGVPLKLFRDEEDVTELREGRAKQQEEDLTRAEDQAVTEKVAPKLVGAK